jgi:membrane associated rhomboid family serine protease
MIYHLTKLTKAFLGVFFVSFIFHQTMDRYFGWTLFEWFALFPGEHFRSWQIFTYPLLQTSVAGLFFNLFALGFLVPALERIWGWQKLLFFCGFCSIMTGFGAFLFNSLLPHSGSILYGCSTLIFGLLTAYGILFSHRVLNFMLFFPISAKAFVLLLALMEFLSALFSETPMMSIMQLSAMVWGYLALLLMVAFVRLKRLKTQRMFGSQPGKKVSHLRLVKNSRPGQSKDN